MTQETAKERIYREALKKTRDRLGSFEELYANKGVYYAFYELTGLVEKGLSQASEIPVSTRKLSVEKLQEIRVEELKDFNSKILQAELKNQKLQKEIDAAKKYIEESYKADKEDNKLLDLIIEAVAKLKSDNETLKKALTESEKMYQKQMDRFLNSEMNESARSHCESQLKLLFPAHKAYEALAAIGGDDGQ